jgi:hypothetical protein
MSFDLGKQVGRIKLFEAQRAVDRVFKANPMPIFQVVEAEQKKQLAYDQRESHCFAKPILCDYRQG